jgi:eukaryotic-like serine/threonine-protein kinase
VFPYYLDGDLDNYLRKHRPLPIDTAVDFMEQILSALNNLHQKSYIHRDIKPQNILVTDKTDKADGKLSGKEVVIADLGLSRSMSCPPSEMTK